MVNPPKVIVFGCGEIFYKHYAHWVIAQFNNLVFCDPSLVEEEPYQRLTALLRNYPNKNVEIEFNSSNIQVNSTDSIFIFTNHKSHFKLIKDSLNASLVFVEKPCVLNSANWNNLVRLASQTKTKFWPAYHQFYTSLADQVDKYNINNQIENLKEINIEFYASNLPVRKWGKSYTSKTLAGGGVFLDLGPHIFSILSILVKNISKYRVNYTSVNCSHTSNDSELETEVEFSATIKDCILSGKVGYIDNTKEPSRKFRLTTADCAVFEYLNGNIIINGQSIDPLNYTNLAFKNLVGDSLNLGKPYYFDHIGWNIESVESFYEKLESSDFKDSI